MNTHPKLSLIGALLIFLIIEILSFNGVFFPIVNQLSFLILVLITLGLSLYKLEYGLLIVLAELLIGSLGHLFYLNIGNYQLAIRIALWSILMLVFTGQLLKQLIFQKAPSTYLQSLRKFSGWKIIGILFIFILIGVVNGFWRQHNPFIIFSDVNAWFYFLLIFPAIIVYGQHQSAVLRRLRFVFLSGTLFLSLETLFLLFVFTHHLALRPDIYFWLRRTISGEITPTLTGWPRIFIQSQSFSAIAFFFVLWFQAWHFKFKQFFQTRNLLSLGLAALFLSTLLLSFSRSFWFGFVGALVFSLILICFRWGWKKIVKIGIWLLTVSILSLSFIYLISAWPYWQTKSANFDQSILKRTTSNSGAAIASRWALLPILTRAIKQQPLLGQGFGSTITYFSHDPRVLQKNPTGRYTTYAFEWGYLSIWLKIGFLGLLAYLWFLLKLVIDSLGLAKKTTNYLFYALPTGIIFLALTHTFTPYLNHPLGIGFLVISSCLIWPNRVY